MPLWDFHLNSGILSPDEKQQLAESITKLYTRVGMPAFYVQVRFTEGQSSTFISGKPRSDFVCVQIDHVARSIDSDKQRDRFLEKTDNVLTPMLKPKGVQWEYWVQQGPRDLWKIDGLIPPPTGSEMEKKWAEFDSPYVGDANL